MAGNPVPVDIQNEFSKIMENDFVKYLFLFIIGMLGVFIGRRMAIRRIMKKKSSSDKKDMV
jgi:hypothetical protein